MAKEIKKGKKPIKKVATKPTKKAEEKKCLVDFNTYSVLLQVLACIIAVAAVVLNAFSYIKIENLFNLFCISIICLALSLFPKRRH